MNASAKLLALPPQPPPSSCSLASPPPPSRATTPPVTTPPPGPGRLRPRPNQAAWAAYYQQQANAQAWAAYSRPAGRRCCRRRQAAPAAGNAQIRFDGRFATVGSSAPMRLQHAVWRRQHPPEQALAQRAAATPRVEDSAYDCSGSVSYVLIKAGLLRSLSPAPPSPAMASPAPAASSPSG
ncbi:MAG: hypothetical protein HS117_00970 [Verrucomicrobiaceae bacterium]|nr:hypothetical protein [Verrucomicrobiaceae bacterium]